MKALSTVLMVLCIGVAGCASNAPVPQDPGVLEPSKQSMPIDVLTKDLQAAAARAQAGAQKAVAAGDRALADALNARAAVWSAQVARVQAIGAQISACKAAIAAAIPAAPSGPVAGVFDAAEAAAEAVGSFSVTPAVKIACEPLPLIPLPALPKP